MTDGIQRLNSFLLNQTRAAEGLATAKDQAARGGEIEEACRNFESLFVGYMMQQMRATVPQSGFLGGGQAEKIYTGMLDQEVAKNISAQRGIGLARIMYEQMSALDDPEKTKK